MYSFWWVVNAPKSLNMMTESYERKEAVDYAEIDTCWEYLGTIPNRYVPYAYYAGRLIPLTSKFMEELLSLYGDSNIPIPEEPEWLDCWAWIASAQGNITSMYLSLSLLLGRLRKRSILLALLSDLVQMG